MCFDCNCIPCKLQESEPEATYQQVKGGFVDKPIFIRVTAVEDEPKFGDPVECKYWLRLERITYLEEIDEQNPAPSGYVGVKTYIMYIDDDTGEENQGSKTQDFYVKESAAELMGRLRDYGVIAIG